MQLKGTFVNSAADIHLLPEIIAAAEKFNPEYDYTQDMKDLAERTDMKSLFL